MTEDEVLAYLRRPDAVLAFDTNTIFKNNPDANRGTDLIDCINQINVTRERAIRKVVPAVVLHEKLRQMRQTYGAGFSTTLPDQFLEEKVIQVEPFEKVHAEKAAARLWQLYPRHGDWRTFKKRRCLTCVGLPASTTTPRDGKECGATVDWLIAAQAEMNGYLLVSDDKGDEFKEVALLARLDVTSNAAKRLLDEVTAAG